MRQRSLALGACRPSYLSLYCDLLLALIHLFPDLSSCLFPFVACLLEGLNSRKKIRPTVYLLLLSS